MNINLAGKTAIVTGGSSGIGLAIAKALYSEGVNIVIIGRDKIKLQKAEAAIIEESDKGNPEISTIEGDLRQATTIQEAIKETISRFGTIDILINNAGSAPSEPFLKVSDESLLDAWNLKLLGYIRFIREVVPYMIEQEDGRIVNIVGAAARNPNSNFIAGGTTNAALLNFSKGVSRDLAKHNIRINSISPGPTSTERVKALAKERASVKGRSVEEEMVEMAKAIPTGRFVDPSEISNLTLLLVSDLVQSLTGTEIIIDGGQQRGV